MTLEEIRKWCQTQDIQVRGIFRGGDFLLGSEKAASGPEPANDVLHWELSVGGKRYPTSTSDLERLVSQRLRLDEFIKMTGSREGR